MFRDYKDTPENRWRLQKRVFWTTVFLFTVVPFTIIVCLSLWFNGGH